MKEINRRVSFETSPVAVARAEFMRDYIKHALDLEKKNSIARRRNIRVAWEWTEKTHKAYLTAPSRHAENMVILLDAEMLFEVLETVPWALIASNGDAIPFTDSPRFAGDRLRLRKLLEEALGHRDNNLRGMRETELAFESEDENNVHVIARVFKSRGRKARIANNGTGKKTVTIDGKYKVIDL